MKYETVKSQEEICNYTLRIKECKIVEFFFKSAVKSDGMKIILGPIQIRATQLTRLKVDEVKIRDYEEPDMTLSSAGQMKLWAEH
ncbi:hypothetical protein NPIL_115971 [Nephila pilipes]|uniref:Uncharacterized protein n=1 Tax=Nephila pilipes TaxID=299642 RepID=A0A8X6QW05_NEPPI|nr:hypothetical protein NPIL_115971 [Nephila pilipes]